MDLKTLESVGLYDYLCNHCDKLSKLEIIDFFKEYCYSVHENSKSVEDKILKDAINSYKERFL